MVDKRVFERFELEVPARVEIEEEGRQQTEIALKTSNICAGGAFFLTDQRIPYGTRLKMDLILSIEKLKKLLGSECRIEVQGEVIRLEERGIAVRFDSDYRIVSKKTLLH